MKFKYWQKRLFVSLAALFLLLIDGHGCYKLSSTETSIVKAINTFGDIGNDFLRQFLEALSLPILAPILVRSGALGGKSLSPKDVEQELRKSGIGTVLHAMTLLPITIPVSTLHILTAPVAIPYRRRIGRAILENHLRREIIEAVRQLQALSTFVEKHEYKLNWINVVPQNTLDHSTLALKRMDALRDGIDDKRSVKWRHKSVKSTQDSSQGAPGYAA